MIKIKCLIIPLLFIFVISNLIAEPSIQVNLPSSNIYSGEPFSMKVEISDISGVSLADLPQIDDVKIFATGTMSNVSIINGKYSSTVTFIFTVRVDKSGEIDIGQLKFIDKNNHEYYSDNILLNVMESEKKNDSGYQTTQKNERKQPYFLFLKVSKPEVLVNEYVDIDLIIYASNENFKLLSVEPIKFPTSAWIENVELKTNYNGIQTINGLRYIEYVMEKKRVYFSQPGQVDFKPIEYVISGYVESGFFSYPERILLRSDEAGIIVNSDPAVEQSLPIGNYEMTSRISSTEIEFMKPITLEIILTGEGDFHRILEIPYEIDPGLNIFSSNRTINPLSTYKKELRWEIILIPQHAGEFLIDILPFKYYNINEKIIKQNEGFQHLIVVKQSSADNFQHNIDEKKNLKYKDLKYKDHSVSKKNEESTIHLRDFKRSILTKKMLKSYYWISLILFILFLAIVFLYLIVLVLLKFEIDYMIFFRKKTLIKVIKSKIGSLRFDPNLIVGIIATELAEYLIMTYNLELSNLTAKNLKQLLQGKIDDRVIDEIRDLMTEIDIAKYSGEKIQDGYIENLLEKIEHLSNKLNGVKT